MWLSTMIFIRSSIKYALSRLINAFRTAIEKQATMITEPTLKSEEMIRIFHRIAVHNFPSLKRVSPMPCDALFGHSICETGCRYYGTVRSWQAERIGRHLAHNLLWGSKFGDLAFQNLSLVFLRVAHACDVSGFRVASLLKDANCDKYRINLSDSGNGCKQYFHLSSSSVSSSRRSRGINLAFDLLKATFSSDLFY